MTLSKSCCVSNDDCLVIFIRLRSACGNISFVLLIKLQIAVKGINKTDTTRISNLKQNFSLCHQLQDIYLNYSITKSELLEKLIVCLQQNKRIIMTKFKQDGLLVLLKTELF